MSGMAGNHNHRRGGEFENSVVKVFRRYGFFRAARTLAGGMQDRGDISGLDNLIIQCKAHKEIKLGPWMKEAAQQAENAGVTRYAVVVKRRGVSDPAESFAVVPLWLLCELALEAT